MRSLCIVWLTTLIAGGPALGEELLHCTDTDAIGFQWQDGKPKPVRYVPYNFTVKIQSGTERVIAGPGDEYKYAAYSCRELPRPQGALSCTRRDVPARLPIVFRGMAYERIGNLSHPIGGAPDLYVAYGRCVEF